MQAMQTAIEKEVKTSFDLSVPGQRAYSLPKESSAWSHFQPEASLLRKKDLPLPELSELTLTRHFTTLSHKNFAIDRMPILLGSCTMKLNPRICEEAVQHPQFQCAHPLAPERTVQGTLEILYNLVEALCSLSGMAAGSIAPNAGAQGELAGIKMIAAYHASRGDEARKEMLVPDDAHGTNPATAKMCGYTIRSIKTRPEGALDLDDLRAAIGNQTAGLMLTNPSTLGLFNSSIRAVAKIVHEAGGLLYYDGANLNALMHVTRPGDLMGFDVMHINLHKTFSTPHGGGGPGSGPVLCNERLRPFLPTPIVIREGGRYSVLWHQEHSIGQIASFFGNVAIAIRAYLYILLHGNYGLRKVSEGAVLNANYLKKKLGALLTIPFEGWCMHEFVARADRYLDNGIRALDIAKRMLDYGLHAPTVYFPLIVKECMLIEPTETESLATLNQIVEVLSAIIDEIREAPEVVRTAPHTLPVSRLDETRAARQPVLRACLESIRTQKGF